MKKIIGFMLLMVITLSLVGCGQKNIEGNLSDLMDQIYAEVPEDKIPIFLEKTEITEENVENFLGSKDIEFEEALVSEPGISSIAHSVILVRTKKGADVEKVKAQIKESINPRKWVCVWVEDEDVIIDNKGNLIVVIMTNDISEELYNGFKKLK